VVEHAPDGDLRGSWAACPDARVLVALGALSGAVRKAVCAACACVRTVLRLVPDGQAHPLRALDATDAWTSGALPSSELQTVAAASKTAADAAVEADCWPYDALVAVLAADHVAALAAHLARRGADDPAAAFTAAEWAQEAVEFAAEAAGYDAAARDSATSLPPRPSGTESAAFVAAGLGPFASIVRAHLPCPTLERLRAAYRR
jgi:hypothetical protein